MDIFFDENLNEMQKIAVTSPSRNILVTAGAGSGKTKVLTERILNLVNCKYVHPENILAITFTNKASNVMKGRLAEKGLVTQRLWISTFHSCCVRILRENARFLEGYNSNFTIYDENDKNKLISQILKEKNIENIELKKNLAYFISVYKNKYQTIDEFKDVSIPCLPVRDVFKESVFLRKEEKQNMDKILDNLIFTSNDSIYDLLDKSEQKKEVKDVVEQYLQSAGIFRENIN